jgi:hypothetical protein
MELTTLSGPTTEDGFAGFFQAGVVIVGDKFNAPQATLSQAFEKESASGLLLH